MTTTTELQKPRPVVGIDIRRLPIGPEEAFVLSRVDGSSNVREISYSTSIAEEQVIAHLKRLQLLGAVEFEPFPEVHAKPPKPQSTPTDLEEGKQREILDLYTRLESLNHYQLLGVPEEADRRAIKAAYYEKVKTFHPDRYFGKHLGEFRTKLDICFARLTDAHDTLTASDRRGEYDTYLRAQRQADALERAISQVVTVDDLDLLEQQLGAALNAQSGSPLLANVEIVDARKTGNVPGDESFLELNIDSPSVPAPKMSDEERKRFFARKLRVSSASLRAPPKTSAPAPSPPPPSREQLASQLRNQALATRRGEAVRQLESHLAAADAALAANDPVAASNALRIAQSLAPNDPKIGERLSEAQALATTALSDTYLRQAEYEEKSGRFETAAKSYERAARGKPSAAIWEAAARCLLEAGGDLRGAGEFARLAIALDPGRAASHLLLGRVFLSAQMRTSAISELERARRLDPNNDTVLSLLKRIANGDI